MLHTSCHASNGHAAAREAAVLGLLWSKQQHISQDCVEFLQVDGNKGLPAQASMRGAYMNTGSRDVGPDKA
jgi:hypothetical protein